MKLPSNVYDNLKYVALIALPALAALYADVAPLWNWPYVTEIPQTINHFAVFLGALLVISTKNYWKEQGGDTE